jgi:hypothetical protein
MLAASLGLLSRGAMNVALNSSVGYGLCKITKEETPRDIAIILAIDSTCRIAAKHLFVLAFGSKVDEAKNMVDFAFLLTTGLIQPASVYLADKLFRAKPPRPISLFGYIALSWKVNMMTKDVVYSLRR